VVLIAAVKLVPKGNRNLPLGHRGPHRINGCVDLLGTAELGELEFLNPKDRQGNFFDISLATCLTANDFARPRRAKYAYAQGALHALLGHVAVHDVVQGDHWIYLCRISGA